MGDNILICTVIESIPELGCAVVAEDAMPGTRHVALLPYPGGSYGAGVFSALKAGDNVACTTMYNGSKDILAILAPLNSAMDSMNNSYGHRRAACATLFTQSYDKLMANRLLAERLLSDSALDFLRVHASGVDADVMPGDCDIRDKVTGTGLHVGRDHACLVGSGLSAVSVFGPGSFTRISGDSVSIDTPYSETVHGKLFNVRNLAITAGDALGNISCDDMDKDTRDQVPEAFLSDSDLSPLYKLQYMEGLPVYGAQMTVFGDCAVKKHRFTDKAAEPPVLSVARSDLDGRLLNASTLGSMSIKTPFVTGVTQVIYGADLNCSVLYENAKTLTLDRSEYVHDLRNSFAHATRGVSPDEYSADTSEKDYDKLTRDAAINKDSKYYLSRDYPKALRELSADLGFSVGAESKTFGEVHSMDPAPSGVSTDAQYPNPPHVDIEDAKTGKKATYYNSTSFISQEPDGSICISDGYGSEIRMCRGNIYISPALDLIFRPGRGMSSMVPGNVSLNAQGRFDISSGDDSVGIRAVRDLKLAAGASDDESSSGNLVIENLSKVGGDLLIASQRSITMHTDALTVCPSAADASLYFTVDAGPFGSIYEKSGTAVIDASETVLGGFNTDGASVSGSAVVVNPGSVSVLTPVVNMPASVNMQKASGNPSVSVLRDGKQQKASVKTAADGSLTVGGSLLVGQGARINNQIIAKSVVAASVGELQPGTYKKADIPANAGIPASAGQTASGPAASWLSLFGTDDFAKSMTFSYPDSFGVTVSVVPGMRWQELAKSNGTQGDAWHEPTVNGTYAYPGKDAWETASVSETGYKASAGLNNGGYATNVKRS